MNCIRPVHLTSLPKKKNSLMVCLLHVVLVLFVKQRAREWALRMEHEILYAKHCVFTTLTYDNEHCPKCYSLIQKDVQKFIKRLRKNTKSELRYYAVGEYGGQFHRPHYHLLLFIYNDNRSFEDWAGIYINGIVRKEGLIRESWNKGFVFNGNVTEGSINYVVEYQDKQIMKHDGVKLFHRRPPFRIMSRGFGEKYVVENAEKLKMS